MRTNYVANAGVRFNMFSQDQLEELFNGVLHVLQYTGLDVMHDEAREILAQGRRVGRRQAGAPAVVHGQGCAAQGAAQLHALGARRQPASTTSTSARAAATLVPAPPARTSSTRKPWSGARTPGPMCRWWPAPSTPCPTSTSASRWARSATCISTWARSTNLPACSRTPASRSSPGLMTSSIRPASTRSPWPRPAGSAPSSSGPTTSITASRCRRWSALSRPSTSCCLRLATACRWSSRPAPLPAARHR